MWAAGEPAVRDPERGSCDSGPTLPRNLPEESPLYSCPGEGEVGVQSTKRSLVWSWLCEEQAGVAPGRVGSWGAPWGEPAQGVL